MGESAERKGDESGEQGSAEAKHMGRLLVTASPKFRYLPGAVAVEGLLADEDGAVGADFAEAAVEIVGDPDVALRVEGEAVGVVAAVRVAEELAAGIGGGGY